MNEMLSKTLYKGHNVQDKIGRLKWYLFTSLNYMIARGNYVQIYNKHNKK